jgi:hypothetical protein
MTLKCCSKFWHHFYDIHDDHDMFIVEATGCLSKKMFFSFSTKKRPNKLEPLSLSSALFRNNGLGWKGLPRTNGLAYLSFLSVTEKKVLLTLLPL